jgi:hypothetical protein
MGRQVYIETSVISYLTAWPSRDLLIAAAQEATQEWWDRRRPQFAVFTSELVWDEASEGDSGAAQRRCERLQGIPILDMTDEADVLAKELIRTNAVPPEAVNDALHIAVAAVNGMDYLLTWNCRHIDNAERKPLIRRVCEAAGVVCPEICTPQELMGDASDG